MIVKFEVDTLKNIQWDFSNCNQWKREFDDIRNLEVRGSGNRNNLIRFATFVVKTLDYITDIQNDKVPIQLFDIGQLIELKIKHCHASQEFKAITWFTSKLKMIDKYDISLQKNNSICSADNFDLQLIKLKDQFLLE